MNNQGQSASPHWPKPSSGKALKHNINCRGFLFLCSVLTCSGCIFLSSLQGSCPAPGWGSHIILAIPSLHALPWKLLLWRGPGIGPWPQTAKLPPRASSANTQLPVQGRACSTAEADRTAWCHHITPPNLRDKDKLAKAQWEGSPAPLSCFLAAPQDLFPVPSSHCVIFPGFSSDIPSQSPEKPLNSHRFPGSVPHSGDHIPSISAAHFCPCPSQAAGFFEGLYSWNSYNEQLLT